MCVGVPYPGVYVKVRWQCAGLLCSFYHVGPGDQIQAFRFDSGYLYQWAILLAQWDNIDIFKHLSLWQKWLY